MVKVTEKNGDISVDVSIDGIRQFLDFAQDCNVHSISVGAAGNRIKVTKNPATSIASSPTVADDLCEEDQGDSLENCEVITSGHIGSFHHIDGIVAGSAVKQGDMVANIYSMKIEHAVRAERDCVIRQIVAEENEVIEYGQPLFCVE